MLKKAIPQYSGDKMNIEKIKRLLDAGAAANGIYNEQYQESFLIHAAKKNMVQLVKVLLDHGADPNFSPDDGRPAVFYGNAEITALFVKHGARFDIIYGSKYDEKQSPLLYHLLYNDNNTSATLVLEWEQQTKNWDITGTHTSVNLIFEWEQQHSPDFCGNYKSRKNYLTAVLASLLDKKSFLEKEKYEVYTLTKRLIDAGADPVPVAYLAKRSSINYGDTGFIIPLLIEKGSPVNTYNRAGETALYGVVYSENLELAKLLLKKGADINQQNKDGKTALMATEDVMIVKFLLEYGANPNLQDNDGKTALMKLSFLKKEIKLALISLFFQAGADPSIKDNKGRTALFHWLSDLDGPLIDELLARGCKIDEPNNEGDTPLLYAASYSRKAVLPLLEKGADPNYRNSEGQTALHVFLLDIEKDAWRHDYDIEKDMPIITALLSAGTRPADKDNKGDSALTTAVRIGKKYKYKTNVGKLVQRYANDDEIKVADATAKEALSKETKLMLSWKVPDTLKALAFPVVLGGISFATREVMYKDNPHGNIMGPVNAIVTLGGSLGFLGLFIGGATGAGNGFGGIVNAAVGGLLFGGIGVILACMSPVYNTFNDNPVLYYIPAAVSAVIASVVVFDIWL
jgi:ankyrin repeat protein